MRLTLLTAMIMTTTTITKRRAITIITLVRAMIMTRTTLTYREGREQ